MIEQQIIAAFATMYMVVDRSLHVRSAGGMPGVLGGEPVVGRHLLELLPELFGYEETLADILDGRLDRLRLPDINRGAPGGVRYLELLTLPRADATAGAPSCCRW